MRLVLFDTENKELSWKERKDATLQNLENCDRKCAMLICADKLSNIRDVPEGLQNEGEGVWEHFKYGRDGQKWLFCEYIEVLARLSDLKMYFELIQAVETGFPKGKKELWRQILNLRTIRQLLLSGEVLTPQTRESSQRRLPHCRGKQEAS